MFEKCEFCEKWDFEIVNFVKKEVYEIVNFVKNETLKMWILSKMKFWICEFLDKMCYFDPVCVTTRRYLCFASNVGLCPIITEELQQPHPRWE